MNTRAFLPHITDTLEELFDAGRNLWNQNQSFLDSAVASTQDKVSEVGKSLIITLILLLFTTACFITAAVVGSVALAERLMASLEPPISHVDSLLLVSLAWLIVTVLVGWVSFNSISSIKDSLGHYGKSAAE